MQRSIKCDMPRSRRRFMLYESWVLRSNDRETRRQRSAVVALGGNMAKLSERIEVLESRLRELRHRQQRVEARKRTLQGQRERRDDTRRKILVGALVLTQVDRGDYPRERLQNELNAFLTRPGDRALFDLDSRATRSPERPMIGPLQEKSRNQPELR